MNARCLKGEKFQLEEGKEGKKCFQGKRKRKRKREEKEEKEKEKSTQLSPRIECRAPRTVGHWKTCSSMGIRGRILFPGLVVFVNE